MVLTELSRGVSVWPRRKPRPLLQGGIYDRLSGGFLEIQIAQPAKGQRSCSWLQIEPSVQQMGSALTLTPLFSGPRGILVEKGLKTIPFQILAKTLVIVGPSQTPPYPPCLTSPRRIRANGLGCKILKTIPVTTPTNL